MRGNVVAVMRPPLDVVAVPDCLLAADEPCLVSTATAIKPAAPSTMIAENILSKLPEVLYCDVLLGIIFSFPDTSLPFFTDFAIAGNKKS